MKHNAPRDTDVLQFLLLISVAYNNEINNKKANNTQPTTVSGRPVFRYFIILFFIRSYATLMSSKTSKLRCLWLYCVSFRCLGCIGTKLSMLNLISVGSLVADLCATNITVLPIKYNRINLVD